MSFNQFARDQYIRVIETNETATMGAYKLTNPIELDQVLLWLNIEGTPGGSESLQIHVYGSADTDTPLYSSEAQNLSDVAFSFDPDLGNWLGVVPFVFNRETLGAQTYYLSVELTNYTRDADNYYIGYVFDNPEAVYSRNVPDATGAKAIMVGYE